MKNRTLPILVFGIGLTVCFLHQITVEAKSSAEVLWKTNLTQCWQGIAYKDGHITKRRAADGHGNLQGGGLIEIYRDGRVRLRLRGVKGPVKVIKYWETKTDSYGIKKRIERFRKIKPDKPPYTLVLFLGKKQISEPFRTNNRGNFDGIVAHLDKWEIKILKTLEIYSNTDEEPVLLLEKESEHKFSGTFPSLSSLEKAVAELRKVPWTLKKSYSSDIIDIKLRLKWNGTFFIHSQSANGQFTGPGSYRQFMTPEGSGHPALMILKRKEKRTKIPSNLIELRFSMKLRYRDPNTLQSDEILIVTNNDKEITLIIDKIFFTHLYKNKVMASKDTFKKAANNIFFTMRVPPGKSVMIFRQKSIYRKEDSPNETIIHLVTNVGELNSNSSKYMAGPWIGGIPVSQWKEK